MPLNTPILFAATTNSAKSRVFYGKALGLKLLNEDDFALVFKVGELSLRVQKVEKKPTLGYTVLGWQVRNIASEIKRLSKAGVQFSRFHGLNQDENGVWVSPSGARVAWFSDPDGNILSLTEYHSKQRNRK